MTETELDLVRFVLIPLLGALFGYWLGRASRKR